MTLVIGLLKAETFAPFLNTIFVERLGRSWKNECIYLRAWSNGSEAEWPPSTAIGLFDVIAQRRVSGSP